jgi:hypothetical protein
MEAFVATICMSYEPTAYIPTMFSVGSFSRLPTEHAPAFVQNRTTTRTSILSDGDDTFIHFLIGHDSPTTPISLYVRITDSFQWEFIDRHGLAFYGFTSANKAWKEQFGRQALLLMRASDELRYHVKYHAAAVLTVLTTFLKQDSTTIRYVLAALNNRYEPFLFNFDNKQE